MEDEDNVFFGSNLRSLLWGLTTDSALLNAISILVNTLAVMAVVDHAWSPLAISHSDLTYARCVARTGRALIS